MKRLPMALMVLGLVLHLGGSLFTRICQLYGPRIYTFSANGYKLTLFERLNNKYNLNTGVQIGLVVTVAGLAMAVVGIILFLRQERKQGRWSIMTGKWRYIPPKERK